MHRDICISNAQPIVAWIDAFIRELYEYRKLLDTDGAPPDTDAVGEMFEDARLARNKWLAGEVNPKAREMENTRNTQRSANRWGKCSWAASLTAPAA